MVRNVTLDTNCLFDLEVDNERAPAVRCLVKLHDSGVIRLSIPAVMASERQRGGVYLESFSEFKQRLSQLGLGHLPQLLPMGYFGVAFWDNALWCDDSMRDLERRIHAVLHPQVAFEYVDHCLTLGIDLEAQPPDRKWRNAKCDVQVMWSHIHHGGDVLVTNDRNFVKESKLHRLIALGAGTIVRTEESPAAL